MSCSLDTFGPAKGDDMTNGESGTMSPSMGSATTADDPSGSETTVDPPTTDATTGAVEPTCENYCGIYPTACKDFAEYDNPEACMAQCKQWPAGEANATGGDSLGCRLYHVTVANTTEPAVHCPHAGPSGAATCVDADAPTCDAYCTAYFSSCTADLNLYADMDACMTQCGAWWPGKTDHTAGDSVGCRLYHAGAALSDPATHCPHAGPDGAAVCVTPS